MTEKEHERDDGPPDVAYLVIDVSHLAFRCAYAMSRFQTRDGRLSGHVYGAYKTLRNLIREFKPQHLVFVYDRGSPWRRELLPGYKENRKLGGVTSIQLPDDPFNVVEKMPDDWTPGPDVERLFRGFPGIHLAAEGMEADDMAAWFVASTPKESRTGAIALYTGDRDYYQLVDDDAGVAVLTTKKIGGAVKRNQNVWIWDDDVRDYFGVPPNCVGKLKALLGDESDNIRGVEGGSRPGKKAALRAFAQDPVADDFFSPGIEVVPSIPVPEWLQEPMQTQRPRLLTNFAVIDLLQGPVMALEKREDKPGLTPVRASLAAALDVLVEFECEGAMAGLEPLLEEMERTRRIPRPFR